jgi:hypothetical protein
MLVSLIVHRGSRAPKQKVRGAPERVKPEILKMNFKQTKRQRLQPNESATLR